MLARAFLISCLLSGLRAAAPPAPWLQTLRQLLEDCPGPRIMECAGRKALGAVDEILVRDRVQLLDGFEFVKLGGSERTVNDTDDDLDVDRKLSDWIRRKGQINEKNGTWSEMLTDRLERLLKTHAIKIDTDRLRSTIFHLSSSLSRASTNTQVEPRGRKRRRQMHIMPIMMMGLLLMGTILIPMSFQFLAVLGGKALILSKLALILSSIQGLKKIATNGVNYGLYHTPLPEVWHERSTSQYVIPYAGDYFGYFSGRSAVKSA